MINEMNFTVCPCLKSQQLLKNNTTDICFKCGRTNIENNGQIIDPIEYWKNLPQIYKDLTVTNDDGYKYVPYFLQQRNKIIYLEQSELNNEFEYVVAKFENNKINMESAQRIPFMEFNKVLLQIG